MRALVALVALDDLFGQGGSPAVVKIDVEGAEELVLRGGSVLLAEVRPVLIVEVSGSGCAEVTARLQRVDYVLFNAANGISAGEVDLCTFNTLAVPREKLGTIKLGM